MSKPITKLSVNVNAVAYLRNRRDVSWPNLLDIARAILDAGAHGITVHPRLDQRHIRFTDVAELSDMLAAEYPEAEFNIEGYPTRQFLDIVFAANAHQVTLVPDSPDQATSDHGWDFDEHSPMLTDVVKEIKNKGPRVSLFLNANAHDPHAAWAVGADRVEFYTGPYGGQTNPDKAKQELHKLGEAAEATRNTGHNQAGLRPALMMNAGHDLTVENLPSLLKTIPDLAEVSIGHAITCDALMFGFPTAVKRYLAVLGHGTK